MPLPVGKAASKADVQRPFKPANSETSLVGADGQLCLSPLLTEREPRKSELGSPLLSDQPNPTPFLNRRENGALTRGRDLSGLAAELRTTREALNYQG